jgi:hypothetical protein
MSRGVPASSMTSPAPVSTTLIAATPLKKSRPGAISCPPGKDTRTG